MINNIEKIFEKLLYPIIFIALLTVLVYSNSFTAPFTLDDFGSIVNNYAIRNPLDIGAIWRFYSNRFVLYYSFSLNYAVHTDIALGYHITNVAIHILNGVLVYLILRSILGLRQFNGKLAGLYRNIISLLGALIFVCHPLQVNAVTYIVQRTASLAATFYFLAVLFFIKYRVSDKIRHFVYMFIFILLAMYTKENTITIPFMLLIIELMFFMGDGRTTWKKRLAFLFLIFLTIPVIPGTNLLLKGYSQSDPAVTFKASTSMDRFHYFYTQMNVIVLYIKLLFFPVNQNFDYSNDFPLSKTLWENNSHISFIVLCVIGLLAILTFRKNKLFSLGILWFYIGLAVESSFISIKDVYFEHRLYFPVAGFVMFIIGIIFFEFGKINRRHLFKNPLLCFLIIAIASIPYFSAFTLRRNYIYSDEIRLWSDVVKKAPNSDRAHSVLGTAYLDAYELRDEKNENFLKLAEEELKKAIELNKNNDTAHCNLSKVYLLKGEYDKSIEEAKTALSMSNSVYAYHNMGMAYKKQGKDQEALNAFLSGYKADSKKSFILKTLGNEYYERNDFENARFYFEEYLKNYNNNEVREKLEKIKSS